MADSEADDRPVEEPFILRADPHGFVDTRGLLGSFKTDLWFPRYRAAAAGSWALKAIRASATRGYWGELFETSGTVLLSGPGTTGSTSWMSITPWEVESLAIGIAAARGHTAVLGLGMGWQAANAALNADVERVTVVERDAGVIALIAEQGVFAQLPRAARDKIELVQADALLWRPPERVDVLLADIWEMTSGDGRRSELCRMRDNIRPQAMYVWGQEILIWLRAQRRLPAALDGLLLRTIIAEDFALPLIVPDWPDYPQKIAEAGQWWGPKSTG